MLRLLTWIPRILAVLYILVISSFAMDAFTGEPDFGEQLQAFLLHLIPSFLTVLSLVVAWQYRILGGILFLVLGLAFTIYFGTWHSVFTFLIVSLPLLVTGILFIMSKLAIQKK
ncbi:MAG: hypothetical protein ACE5FF_07990 [Saprospiraceae bacterium]